MRIDWWTLTLQTINVLVLVWLLSRFLFRPVMDAIAARQAYANALLADARAAKDAAVAEEAALKARNSGFAAETEQRRCAALAEIDAERARLLDRARDEATALGQQASAADAAMRAKRTTELEKNAAILAGEMAGRLLGRLSPDITGDAMFDALLTHLRSLPAIDRAALARDGALTLVSPELPVAAAQARYRQALAIELPGTTATFAADPSLIAGFDLRGAHIEIRNNWRADLDAMLRGLEESDHARLG